MKLQTSDSCPSLLVSYLLEGSNQRSEEERPASGAPSNGSPRQILLPAPKGMGSKSWPLTSISDPKNLSGANSFGSDRVVGRVLVQIWGPCSHIFLSSFQPPHELSMGLVGAT